MPKKDKQTAPPSKPQPAAKPAPKNMGPWYNQLAALLSHKWYSLIIIGVIGGLFYVNTYQNTYALDDVMFITMNSYINADRGVPKLDFNERIEKIITQESLTGFIGEGSKSIGGRWRPLSLIMFAIEWEWFGDDPHPKHAIHVLIYILLCISVLVLLRRHIFKDNPIAAFIATLLFAIHPIHTEVMANIKSRDELLSMLFVVLTMLTSLNFINRRKPVTLIVSLTLYFLALLSKENGMALIAILPLTWFVFTKASPRQIVLSMIGYVVIFVFYFALRTHFVPFTNYHLDEIMNAPFAYATPIQRMCTVVMLLGKYLMLLFWPYPLSYDYSYNQVPYVGPVNPGFIISLLVYGALLLGSLWFIRKKSIVAYGILFYLLSMFIVSNLVVDTGVVIGERFLFQPSLGWAIAIAAVLVWLVKKANISIAVRASLALLVLGCVTLVALAYTHQRNAEWSADTVLMPHDALVSPNSARAANGGGSNLILVADAIKDSSAVGKHIKDSLLREGVRLMKHALVIHPRYDDPLLNLGVAYLRLNQWDSVAYYWNRADSQYKANFFTDIAQRHAFPIKIYKDKRTVIVNNKIDGVHAFIGLIDEVGPPIKVASASVPGDSAETYKETHPKLKYEFFPILSDHYTLLANSLGTKKKDYAGSRQALKMAMHYNTRDNAELYFNFGAFYCTIGQFDSARAAWQTCLKMDPRHAKAKEGMEFLRKREGLKQVNVHK